MTRVPALLLAVSAAALLTHVTAAAKQPSPSILSVDVKLAPGLTTEPVDGRLLVIISRGGDTREPRFKVGRGLTSEPLFGMDVEGLSSIPDSDYHLVQKVMIDSLGSRARSPSVPSSSARTPGCTSHECLPRRAAGLSKALARFRPATMSCRRS